MSAEERFRQACRELGANPGWSLQPNGIRLDLPGARHQLVSLALFDFGGESFVRLTTTIGSARELTPVRFRIAMRLNAETPRGAFAVRDDELVMTETIPLHDSDRRELESAVHYLAEAADRHEAEIFEADEN